MKKKILVCLLIFLFLGSAVSSGILLTFNFNSSQSEENNSVEQIIQDESDEKIEEHIEDIELEARFVANKIKELIANKFQVYDRKKEKYRKDQVFLHDRDYQAFEHVDLLEDEQPR